MKIATHRGKCYDVIYSVVNVSELEGELRIDAEYYDPFYLNFLERKLKRKKYLYFSNLIEKMVRNPMAYGFSYRNNGIPFIRIDDLYNPIIDYSNVVYIDQETHSKLKSTQVEYNDILMGVRGNTIGRLGIYKGESYKANISPNVIIFRLKQAADYVSIFLLTKFGKLQIDRILSGTGQPTVTTDTLKSLKIPLPSDTFQSFIEKLVLKSYEERQKAEQLYKQAEDILLEKLGIKNWKPKTKKIKLGGKEFEEEENISIRMLSEIMKADRMDAEYWEPKYDEIEELMKNFKNGFSEISKEFLPKTAKLKINREDYYNYVEISSVNTSVGDFNPSYLKGEELPANAKLKLDKNDLIVSKVRTYRKGIALIHKTYPNLIGSSAFVVLHEKEEPKINIETLFVFLRTDIFSLLSYKFYTGTSYPTLTDNDILNLPIPLIPPQPQQKISQLIQQSFKARENSKKLLEIAKRMVEIYIEKNEEEGLNYAKNKLNKINIKIY